MSVGLVMWLAAFADHASATVPGSPSDPIIRASLLQVVEEYGPPSSVCVRKQLTPTLDFTRTILAAEGGLGKPHFRWAVAGTREERPPELAPSDVDDLNRGLQAALAASASPPTTIR